MCYIRSLTSMWMGATVGPFLYAVAAGLVVAIASLVEKLGLATTQPYAGLFVRSGSVIVFLGLSAIPLARYADWSGFTPRAIFLLALGGLLAGLVAHFLYWQSLKATDPHFALPIFVATSQAGVVVLSAVLLRARISTGQVLGVLFLVAGISLIQLTRPS
jgi:uncharacterized membrane protein